MQPWPRRSKWVRHDMSLVVVAAAFLFTANAARLSLLPLDDCFYARKGVEMLERGFSFTATWSGHPNHQNPPLPFWLLGASYALFGHNDFAARIPSMLMALGTLLLTHRIGSLLLGRDAAVAGVGMLLLCPLFVTNARRCMLEVPNAFWATLSLYIAFASQRRPRLAVWLALPLAAGALTKSLLGLLPLLVMVGFALHPGSRRLIANRWLWAGAGLGLIGGAVWPLHQGLTAGWEVVRAHYQGEIGGRAFAGLSVGVLTEYPRVLMQEFQLAVIPGGVAAALALRRAGRWPDAGARVFLALWALLPVIVLSFSSARSARYVFPILVPLSLLAGDLIVSWKRRAALLAATRVIPALLAAVAVVLWLWPSLLVRDQNAIFKRAARDIQRLVPAGSHVPLWGAWSWRLANPFVYYAERGLEAQPDASLAQVLASARQLPVPCLIVSRERMPAIAAGPADVQILADFGDWLFVLVPTVEPQAGDSSMHSPPRSTNSRGSGHRL